MFKDILILQSENRNIVIVHYCFRALCISIGSKIMNRSIQFNDQCRIRSEKIHDKPTNRHLSSEFQSLKFPIPDNIPQNYLGGR